MTSQGGLLLMFGFVALLHILLEGSVLLEVRRHISPLKIFFSCVMYFGLVALEMLALTLSLMEASFSLASTVFTFVKHVFLGFHHV